SPGEDFSRPTRSLSGGRGSARPLFLWTGRVVSHAPPAPAAPPPHFHGEESCLTCPSGACGATSPFSWGGVGSHIPLTSGGVSLLSVLVGLPGRGCPAPGA